MQELNLRLGQAVALTYAQTDDNFKRLKTAIDALEVAVAGAGLGTVTSVGLTLPNIFTVTNSPVTTTGSLTATLASQSANRIFASPNGSSGQPTFRSLLAADLGSMIVPIANGGTGSSVTATANQVISSTGSVYEGRTITPSGGLTVAYSAGSIALGLDPALINISGFAGVLTVAKGGTGLSGAPANGSLLIGNGVAYANTTLTAGTGISITNGAGTITIANTATGVSQLNGFTGALNLYVDTLNDDVQITNISPNITLSIPTASSTKRGALQSADWTTFNNKIGGSGTNGTIPIFTGANSIGNSLLTYTSAFLTGNLTFTSGESGSKIETVGTVSGEVRASGVGGTRVTYISANSSNSNLGWTNAQPLNFVQGSTTRASFDASGNFAMNGGLTVFSTGNAQFSKGFALNGWAYWNVPGTYTFANNELYGVVLGTASDNTMTVALPTAPMDGQEICVLCEENKTLTITSSKAIFGHTGGTNINIAITGGGAGAATLMVKYAAGANGGVGAWFITGL